MNANTTDFNILSASLISQTICKYRSTRK